MSLRLKKTNYWPAITRLSVWCPVKRDVCLGGLPGIISVLADAIFADLARFFSEYCLNLCLARNSGKQVTELMEALLGGRQVDRMVAGALSRLVVVW
jgi:hypothetical protein